MICQLCREPLLPGEELADVISMSVHRECMLRNVIGGIGHLIDHAHFCSGVGPDAGLDFRTSALLVDIWVARKGVKEAVRGGS